MRVEMVLSVLNMDMSSAPAVLPYKSPPAVSPYLHRTDAACDPPANTQKEWNLHKATWCGNREPLPNLTNSAYRFYLHEVWNCVCTCAVLELKGKINMWTSGTLCSHICALNICQLWTGWFKNTVYKHCQHKTLLSSRLFSAPIKHQENEHSHPLKFMSQKRKRVGLLPAYLPHLLFSCSKKCQVLNIN